MSLLFYRTIYCRFYLLMWRVSVSNKEWTSSLNNDCWRSPRQGARPAVLLRGTNKSWTSFHCTLVGAHSRPSRGARWEGAGNPAHACKQYLLQTIFTTVHPSKQNTINTPTDALSFFFNLGVKRRLLHAGWLLFESRLEGKTYLINYRINVATAKQKVHKTNHFDTLLRRLPSNTHNENVNRRVRRL